MGVPTLRIGKLFRGAGVIASLFLLAAIPVLAQVPTGTILGVVKDSSGAVVAGATVTILSPETGYSRTTNTGDDGAYRVPTLPTGHYQVKAERAGFKTETQQGLTLNVSDNAVINFTLQVGTSTQEVVVTSEAPLAMAPRNRWHARSRPTASSVLPSWPAAKKSSPARAGRG